MHAADVLTGSRSWSCEASCAHAWLRSLPSASVDVFITSPPYEAARTYGIGHKLRGQSWVDWMRPIVVEAARVCRGLVVVNMAGQVRDHRYSCAVEFLVSDLVRLDGLAVGPSPYAWVRNGIAGSGGPHYHRRNWEPVYAFARPEALPLPWSENTAMGDPPKWGPGGEMSHRLSNGKRKNAYGVSSGGARNRRCEGSGERITKKMSVRCPHMGGKVDHQDYAPPVIANPGNVIKTGNGVVGDMFTGSGTTAHAAVMHGRRFVGCDLRQSQVELTTRRMASVSLAMFK